MEREMGRVESRERVGREGERQANREAGRQTERKKEVDCLRST